MKILLAVSGGIDSMYMVKRALDGALFPFDCEYAVAHCNFSLRGDESDGDEAFVREFCTAKGLRLFVTRFDTATYAAGHKISIEMAARDLRYAWFEKLCLEEGFEAIALAHNANDNVETMLLNLLRGCGSRGLRGMGGDSGAFPRRLIRPLLGTSREQIQRFMTEHQLPWREDSTNAEDLYKRNALRLKVLPVFKELNPAYLNTLASDMEHVREVDDIAEDYYLKNMDKVGNPAVLMQLKHWKYVLYREMQTYGFNEDTCRDLCGLMESGRPLSGKQFFSPTHILHLSSSELIFEPKSEKQDSHDAVTVSGEGIYELCGRRFRIEFSSTPDNLKAPDGTLYLNASKLSFPFVLRPWRDGDYIRPLGLKGKKKLSDLFVDLKIPAYAKSRAIVLCPCHPACHEKTLSACHVERSETSTEVSALLCLRTSERLRVNPTDARIIKITELL